MIHPEDEQYLLAMLGGALVPEDVRQEYELRVAMFHRAGTGPLGPIGLVDLLRSLGHKPANMPEEVQNVEWRDYPQDGSVRVEARFFGSWVPGVFLGFVEAGTLAVRLDDDDMVKECRRDMVRLAPKDVPPPPERPPRADLLDDTQELPAVKDQVPDEPDDGPDGADYVPIDWSKVDAGAVVWVQPSPEEDILDGEFVSAEEGRIRVKLDGEEDTKEFPADAVTLYG